MKINTTRRSAILALMAMFALPATRLSADPNEAPPVKLSPTVIQQINALNQEKVSRTPAQKKLASQLVYAIKGSRGEALAPNIARLNTNVQTAADSSVLVDIKATVSDALLAAIKASGGTVVSSHPAFKAVRARLPIAAIEGIAGREDVQNIGPADTAMTQRWIPEKADRGTDVTKPLVGPTTNVGSLTSEGDAAHAAATARTTFGVDGTGVKIGVISDSASSGSITTAQNSGDLPGTVTILSGQAGSGSDEGTAMLEIVHDIAPGAELVFATGFGGAAQMAQNILDLRAAGCDIIIDDVSYGFDDGPFQAGLIEQAVNDVSADGALYFSSAANSGNKNDGTSGTYEGDFLSGGAATGILAGAGTVHDFGGGTTFNTVTKASNGVILYWSDSLGASNNDYDIYLLNAAGDTIVGAGTDTQNGTQDPVEFVGPIAIGQKVVVAKFSGSDRFFHLDSLRGQLTVNTQGSTRGHNAAGAANAFSVAATDANNSAPSAFVGGSTNPVETFSSDGPRRLFFDETGTAITPGNFSSTGGQVLLKPDITAADGVQCVTAGFNPFFGTSAAAPHAGALAALVKSFNPSLSPAQIREVMQATALDIEEPGYDRDSGNGIIMADRMLQAVDGEHILFDDSVVLDDSGNGIIDTNECIQLFVDLMGSFKSSGSYTSISATLSTSTLGVTLAQPTVTFPDIASFGSGSNPSPFKFSTSPTFVPGTPINFTLNVTYDGGSDLINFSLNTGILADQVFTGTIDGSDATQTGRLTRDGTASTCANNKTSPGLFTATGARGFESQTFTNGNAAACVTVRLDNTTNSTNSAFCVAYAGSFNPADPSANYLADMGSSSESTTMSFNVAANQTFVVVVHELNPAQGVPSYTLTVGGVISTTVGTGPCPTPEIEVKNPTGGDLIDGTASIGFANVLVQTSLTKTLTIKNTGTAALNNLAITVDGKNAANFTVTQPLLTTLAIGGSTTFTLKLKPTALGLRQAALHIVSNDPDENPFDIKLFGIGVAPEIAVKSPTGKDLKDGTSTFNFGSRLVRTSGTKTFKIKNTGTAPLRNLVISKNGANATNFKITQPLLSVIPVGGSTTFTVMFKPTAKGKRVAAIHIASSDTNENPFDIALTGNGLAPEIAVKNPSGKNLTDGKSTVNLGSTVVKTSVTQTFKIKNVGNAKLKNLSISQNGSNSANFTVTQPLLTTLTSGASTSFTVTFTPSATGKRIAAIHIASNDSNENPFDLTLTGTGLSKSAIPSETLAEASLADLLELESSSSPDSDADGLTTVTSTDWVDGLKYLVLEIKKPTAGAPFTSHVEVSSDLLDWYSGTNHTTVIEDNKRYLKVRDNTPLTPETKRYIRLK